MRKIIYPVLCFSCFLLVYACTGTNKGSGDNHEAATQLENNGTEADQKMQVSENSVSVELQAEKYTIHTLRKPDTSLPKIKTSAGTSFLDNRVMFSITDSKGKKIFEKVFTKKDFASIIDIDFLSHSILEGLVYDTVTSKGFVLAASVCYPDTDLYIPVKITVTPKGQLHMEKENQMGDTYISSQAID